MSAKTPSLYGAYNARWLTPREVAETFVPIPQFNQLVETQSSVLMGPRGCGKTTLLKMLTPDAQARWKERLLTEPHLSPRPVVPDFTAIYVPSDLRWTSELTYAAKVLAASSSVLSERFQRYFITLSALSETCGTFETLAGDDEAVNQRLARAFASEWRQAKLVPTLAHLRARLELHAGTLRGALNRGSDQALDDALGGLPTLFGAHAVDALTSACAIYESEIGRRKRPRRWALCFDELEIAPDWLQKELLSSFRSIPSRFLLKLTWTPVLPSLITKHRRVGPEHKQDFEPIKLWQSHLGDADDFSRQLTTNIIRNRLEDDGGTPAKLFGQSMFAMDRERTTRAYAKGSPFWKAMIKLAGEDPSFEAFLLRKGLDPHNPTTRSRRKRDQVLRKIKPIVLLRLTFGQEGDRRSRKQPPLYSGEQSIYAMSDGNPRWLAGIVNDLVDSAQANSDAQVIRRINRQVQAQVLSAASRRMHLHVKHLPVGTDLLGRRAAGLFPLVERLGEICRHEVLGRRFTDDPVGSFIVDGKTAQPLVAAIETGLTLGALIAVTEPGREVPESIWNTRFRLTFMLSPIFKLLFRNYRWVSLSTALAAPVGKSPNSLFEDQDETD